MVRIGDFARMGRVSIKTLRYYDEADLLKPAHTDPATGYRYYSASQLPLLNRLLVYKSLGFSLDQARALASEDAAPSKLRDLLETRRNELTRRLELEQAQLAQVESRIRQIEREGRLPVYEVLLKETEPKQVVTARRTLSNYASLDSLLKDIGAALPKSEVEGYGAIWHQCLFSGGEIDCEAFAIVKSPLPAPSGCSSLVLPGGSVASVVYSDADEDPFPQVYRAVLEAIDSCDYEVLWPMREIYYDVTRANAGVTEIQFRVQKAIISTAIGH
jgi:DNA-binding transcriptional MerR regulator